MPNFAPFPPTQSRAVGIDLAIGQIDLIGESGEVVKSWRIRKSKCTIGSSMDCNVQLTAGEIAPVHATLVFGKKHTLLRSVGPTLISKRHVREWLIDEPTEIVVGQNRLIVYPSNCVSANLVHSENLVEQASRLCKDQSPDIALFSTQSIVLPSQENPTQGSPSRIERFDPIAAARLDAIEKLLESLKMSLDKMQASIGLEAKSSSESIVQSVTMEIDEFGKRLFTDLNNQLSSQSEVQESLLTGIADQFSGRFGAIDEQLNRFYESSTIQTNTLNELFEQASAEQQHIENRFQELLAHRNELMDAVQVLRTEILLASSPESNLNLPTQTSDGQLVVDSGFTQNQLVEAQTGFVDPEFAEFPQYFESELASPGYEDRLVSSEYSSGFESPAHPISDEQLAHSLELAQVQIQELNLQLRNLEMERDAAKERIASLSEASVLKDESDSTRTFKAMASADEPVRSSVDNDYGSPSKELAVERIEAQTFQSRELPAWYKQDEPEQFKGTEESPQSIAYSGSYSSQQESSHSFSTPDLSSYSDSDYRSETNERSVREYHENSSLDSSLSQEIYRDGLNHDDEDNSNLENLDSISDRLKRMLADADQRRAPTVSKPKTSQSWSQKFNSRSAEIASEDVSEAGVIERPEYLESPQQHEDRRSEAIDEVITGSYLQAADQRSNNYAAVNGQRSEPLLKSDQEFEASQATYPDEPIGQDIRNPAAEKASPMEDEVQENAEEESIEDYMQRLLNRVRGETENKPVATQAKIPATVAPKPLQSTPTKPRSRVAAAMGLEMEESLPTLDERLDEELFVPRQQAPEQRNDLAALRELANTNARRAITRSDIRRTNSAFFVKLGVTALSVFSAVALFLFNGFELNAPFVGMVSAIVVAFLWGFDCVNHFKRLKNVGQNQATPAETAAGQSIRVGNSESETGWRPTPA
jgi:hypothetical protein